MVLFWPFRHQKNIKVYVEILDHHQFVLFKIESTIAMSRAKEYIEQHLVNKLQLEQYKQ